MSFFPEIEDGQLSEEPEKKPYYTFPRRSKQDRASEEDRLRDLNNLNRDEVAEDFSDSPHLK